MTRRAKYAVLAPHAYWPVVDITERVVALCPTNAEAQAVAEALNRPKPRRGSRRQGKDT
jgi:hypothetical protein